MPRIEMRGKNPWLRIPAATAQEIGLEVGDEIDIKVSPCGTGLVIVPKGVAERATKRREPNE